MLPFRGPDRPTRSMSAFPTLSVFVLAQAQTPGSLAESFAQSGPMAKLILGVLAAFSLISWAVTIWK